MFSVRTFRLSAAVLAAAVAVGTVGAMPAEAGKPAPAPTGLAASVTPHQNGSYDVAASWNKVSVATSYRVALTKNGATLASATVTTTSWSPKVTTTPGNASLSVRAVAGRKPGKTSTLTVPLPDVTPPSGGFQATFDTNTGHADLAVTTPVTDNSGGVVTATVDWADGTPPQAWNLTSDITHDYAHVANRYVPVVTLTGPSNNHTTVDVNAVVVMDTQAPTGTFTAAPAGAWAKLTRVTLTQSAIHDNWSPDATITRSVDWGDGSAPQAWTTGSTLTHTYAVAGSYTPAVTLTDEAGNATTPAVASTAVVVKADTVAPKVKLTLPASKHSVKAWRKLRGTATDSGTGVKSVWLKAVEKRGKAWYGYNATTHAWVKTKTKAKAFAKAKAFTLRTNSAHQWHAKLAHLRKGTLIYKVRATDKVNNRSATLTHKATLTKR